MGNIQYSLEELRARRSVRAYADRPLPQEVIEGLQKEVEEINGNYPGLRLTLVLNSGDPFSTYQRAYGKITGVNNYLICVVKKDVENIDEIAGYAGQQFVMAASRAGLGTCFVAVTYNAEELPINVKADEEVAFVIPVGYAAPPLPEEHPSLPASDFYDEGLAFFNLQEALAQMPGLMTGLTAIACAPSGMNKQPVRVWIGEDTFLHAGLAFTGDYTSYDLGIAKFNFQAVIPGQWEWGVDGRFQKA